VVESGARIRNSVHGLFLQAGYNLQQHDEAAILRQSQASNGSRSHRLTRMRKSVETVLRRPFMVTKITAPSSSCSIAKVQVDDVRDDDIIHEVSVIQDLPVRNPPEGWADEGTNSWADEGTGSRSTGIHILQRPRNHKRKSTDSSIGHSSHQRGDSSSHSLAELSPVVPLDLPAPMLVQAAENGFATHDYEKAVTKESLDTEVSEVNSGRRQTCPEVGSGPLQPPVRSTPRKLSLSPCFDVSLREDGPPSSAGPSRPSRNSLQAPSAPDKQPARRISFAEVIPINMAEVAREVRVHREYPWMLALTLLQIALFSLSLSAVRFMIVVYWWENSTGLSITSCVLVATGGPALGYLLGKSMPAFAVLIARAEFMEARNVNWVSIILEDHVTGRDLFSRASSRRHMSRCMSRNSSASTDGRSSSFEPSREADSDSEGSRSPRSPKMERKVTFLDSDEGGVDSENSLA